MLYNKIVILHKYRYKIQLLIGLNQLKICFKTSKISIFFGYLTEIYGLLPAFKSAWPFSLLKISPTLSLWTDFI